MKKGSSYKKLKPQTFQLTHFAGQCPQYLAGLRQELSSRNIIVNVLVSGYINTKINAGLELNKNLLMEPNYVAKYIVNAGNSFSLVPNFKWKIIYYILKILPESLVAKLP